MSKPLIGICMDHVVDFPTPGRDRSYLKLYPTYVHSVLQAGGTPLLLPIVPDPNELRPLLELVAGVVMIGADDYPSAWYGRERKPTDNHVSEVRAAFDRKFVHILYDETDLPVFAVCGGLQLAAIHSGGALIQHLPDRGGLEHREPDKGAAFHAVELDPESRLARACGVTQFEVNSVHHQAVESTAGALKAVAHAPDGVIEACEFTDHEFRIGVQWHPERMEGDVVMARLWRSFVEHAERFAAQRRT